MTRVFVLKLQSSLLLLRMNFVNMNINCHSIVCIILYLIIVRQEKAVDYYQKTAENNRDEL